MSLFAFNIFTSRAVHQTRARVIINPVCTGGVIETRVVDAVVDVDVTPGPAVSYVTVTLGMVPGVICRTVTMGTAVRGRASEVSILQT